MVRSAIIICLVNYCAFLFSQNPSYSRKFEAPRKNLPVQIVNNHTSYFYVLRQNKAVHDITVERRAKPSGEIIAFTPLKLDSVNAGWFDYEKLDYLFFEHKHKAYFLFEKILNSKKTVYLKIIDTSGKSTGFIELASLEKDISTVHFGFIYRRTCNNNILIIASRTSVNGVNRKVALLFSLEKKEIIWTKRLPLENSVTVYSGNFECNDQNDLFYLQTRFILTGYDTYYGDNGRYTLPTLVIDSLFLVEWKNSANAPVLKNLDITELTTIKNSFISANDGTILISIEGIREDSNANTVEELITNFKINSITGNQIYKTTTVYDSIIKKQLTFYDGPHKQFYYKSHAPIISHVYGGYVYALSERTEENYYKELLFHKTDLETGKVVLQKIIPRKIFFFKNRTRFKNIAKAMPYLFNDQIRVVMLETPSNFKKNPNNYNYRDLRKETNLWGSNIVMYKVNNDGSLEKELIFHNTDFDLIPLNYESNNQQDMIFYLNSGKYEKFSIWNPNPF